MDNVIVVTVFLVAVLLASIDIARRVVVEFLHMRRQREIHKKMRQLRRPVQPWVTVIVYGRKEESRLQATLRSIHRSRYYAYDVVVVGPRAQTYQTAYRKSKRGNIVICVPSGLEVDPLFIKRAVASGAGRRSWRVAIREGVTPPTSVIGVVNRLRHMVWGRPKTVEVCVAAALRQKKIPHVQASWVDWVPLLTYIVLIVGSIAGIIHGNISVLWWIWLLVTGYLLALVWLRSYERSTRWRLVFSAPSALFLLPVASVIVGISQVSTRKW